MSLPLSTRTNVMDRGAVAADLTATATLPVKANRADYRELRLRPSRWPGVRWVSD